MIELTCSAILFDLDGVLIDSTPAVSRVWASWAKQHDLDPAQIVHDAHGRPSIETVRQFLPNADAERENARVEQAELEDVDGIIALPGARELLQAVPGQLWTIVTSGTRRLAEVRLAAAGLRAPERMVTASDITQGKPDPEPYLKGAALLGVAASDCIVIEDVAAGVRSAKGAGATVIGVETTVQPDELLRAGADYIVSGCKDIAVRSSGPPLLVRLNTQVRSATSNQLGN